MRYLLSVILFLVFISCNKEKDFDCLKSTGTIVKEYREPGFFNKILLQDGVHLIFVPDSVQKIVVEAGKHLIPKIITRLTNDSLIIEDQNYCNWVRSFKKEIKVFVHGNPGIKLYNQGYGMVSGKVAGNYFFIKSWSNENTELELDVDFMWMESFKLGNSTLSGKADSMAIFRHETGRVDMSHMQYCKGLLFHDHGQGESFVRADSSILVKIFDSGNVTISGKPPRKEIYEIGSGRVYFK